MNDDRHRLREALRRRRAALSERDRRAAAVAVALRFARHPAFRRAHHVAMYSACGSEIDLWPLIRIALRNGKRVYLPRVRGQRMHFVPYTSKTRLLRGAFGILEPMRPVRPMWQRQLDLVIVPLVGFDPAGNRLGQGGGYYDRAFAGHRFGTWRRPVLAGAAFDLQRCAKIVGAKWDVPLDFVLTERAASRT